MAKHEVRLRVALLAFAGMAGTASAQGAVRGQVSITERPGEISMDLGSSVVYLQPVSPIKQKQSDSRTQMAMQGRQFAPRVAVIPAGSTVEFPNQDPFSHNIFSTAAGAAFDLGTYAGGTTRSFTFRKTGAFPIYCNIHSGMTSYVVVVATPYRVLAGADGRWTLPGVAAGSYDLHVWHERAPELVQPLQVPLAGVDGVASVLDARGYEAKPHLNKFGKEYTSTGKDRY